MRTARIIGGGVQCETIGCQGYFDTGNQYELKRFEPFATVYGAPHTRTCKYVEMWAYLKKSMASVSTFPSMVGTVP